MSYKHNDWGFHISPHQQLIDNTMEEDDDEEGEEEDEEEEEDDDEEEEPQTHGVCVCRCLVV